MKNDTHLITGFELFNEITLSGLEFRLIENMKCNIDEDNLHRISDVNEIDLIWMNIERICMLSV